MKKRIIIVISIFVIILLFVILKFNNNYGAMYNSDEIQLWFYDSDSYGIGVSKIIVRKVEEFCVSNNIPLKIFEYNKDTMTYQDYLLKRNISAATGNMITIDDARNLIEISKHHADYTKLENYNNLLNIHKNRYCIPLGINCGLRTIDNEILEYYDIKTNKKIITYNEYLEIKQEIKEKSAKFKLNILEYSELIDYYLNKNGIIFVDKESENIKDSNKFKEILKKSIIELCNDIKLNYDGKLDKKNFDDNNESNGELYDENSNLLFADSIGGTYCITNPIMANPYHPFGIKDILNKTLFISNFSQHSPSLYMHKKITNKKIYDIANYILSESCYSFLYEGYSIYMPTFDTPYVRNIFQVNERWEYIGNPDETSTVKKEDIKSILDEVFKVFIKDQLSEVYDYYYLNTKNTISDINGVNSANNLINNFIEEIIFDIAKNLSEDNLVLSLENFDSQNPEIIKIIDDKVNQFVDNFYVHNY
jgi:hypothetical protein